MDQSLYLRKHRIIQNAVIDMMRRTAVLGYMPMYLVFITAAGIKTFSAVLARVANKG